MGLFDSIIGQVSQHADLGNLATKIGLSNEQVETAIAALARGHQAEGDTVENAATETGMDKGILDQIVQQIGGQGSLGEFARMIR